MPAYQLVVTDDAEFDMAKARQWYEEQAGLGSAFLACIDKQLAFIESQPLATPIVAYGIRRSVVTRFPYNIYYAINDGYINILAVWHGSRDQARLLSQLGATKGQ
jgi:plasmid stabilization system protein ParE